MRHDILVMKFSIFPDENLELKITQTTSSFQVKVDFWEFAYNQTFPTIQTFEQNPGKERKM